MDKVTPFNIAYTKNSTPTTLGGIFFKSSENTITTTTSTINKTGHISIKLIVKPVA